MNVSSSARGSSVLPSHERSPRRGEVIVVEREERDGGGVSSRNSEVVHAGIYYPTGLDKTRLCVDGKAMLYAFCQEFGVPHKRCGKLLVAANAGEVDKLAALEASSKSQWRRRSHSAQRQGGARARARVGRTSRAVVALDRHHRQPCFHAGAQGDAEAHGAIIAFGTPVLAGRAIERGLVIETGGPAPMRIAADMVVNAAGLGAQALARSIVGLPAEKFRRCISPRAIIFP